MNLFRSIRQLSKHNYTSNVLIKRYYTGSNFILIGNELFNTNFIKHIKLCSSTDLFQCNSKSKSYYRVTFQDTQNITELLSNLQNKVTKGSLGEISSLFDNSQNIGDLFTKFKTSQNIKDLISLDITKDYYEGTREYRSIDSFMKSMI